MAIKRDGRVIGWSETPNHVLQYRAERAERQAISVKVFSVPSHEKR